MFESQLCHLQANVTLGKLLYLSGLGLLSYTVGIIIASYRDVVRMNRRYICKAIREVPEI